MEKEKIIEGNKLIAEFMGGKIIQDSKHGIECEMYGFPQKIGITIQGEEGMEYLDGDYSWNTLLLEYHSSWDWLMTVVDKIESLFFNVLIEHHTTLRKKPECYIYNTAETFDMKPIQRDKKINAVYEAIVEFIKWRNQNKKNNP